MAARAGEKLGVGLKNLGDVPFVFNDPMNSEFIL